MSLVEGEERVAIPSMSWSSVVGDDDVDVGADADAETIAAVATDSPPPAPADAGVSFQMTTLGDEEQPAPDPTSTPAPPPPPISFTMGPQAATDAQPTSTVLQPAITDEPVSSAKRDTSAPSSGPSPLSLSIPLVSETATVSRTGDLEPVGLPPIVEATPPESVATAVAALHTAPVPAAAATHDPTPVAAPTPASPPNSTPQPDVVAHPAPVPVPEPRPATTVESVAVAQAVPPALPELALPQAATAPVVPQMAPATERPPRKQRAKKDRSRALARTGFFLLFVAAVVSAGVIFGQPYLFPADWEDNALPYAEAVEDARGTAFVEPVLLTAQTNAAHRDLVSQQLLGDAQERMPMWRALGLAGPDATDDASLRDLTSGQSPVLYSTVDGQVYYDQSFNQAHRDRLITQAMATAAIDQDVAFSPQASERGLDANALVGAHVLQQSGNIAELAGTTTMPVPEPDVAALAFLPPVLDYRMTAPVVLSEVLSPVDDQAPNPLEGNGAEGPVAARGRALEPISTISTVAGDVPVGDAVSMDRGFWYLVLAGHLDAITAYDVSNTLERAGLQTVEAADGRTCAVATLAAANETDGERLASSLVAWTASVTPELGASVDLLPDAAVQLRTCDPVGAFASNARFGVARELIGWRATETVVVDTLTADGATDATITRALALVGSIPSVQNVILLPAGTPPSGVAAAARDAAADVVAAAIEPPAAEAGG